MVKLLNDTSSSRSLYSFENVSVARMPVRLLLLQRKTCRYAIFEIGVGEERLGRVVVEIEDDDDNDAAVGLPSIKTLLPLVLA